MTYTFRTKGEHLDLAPLRLWQAYEQIDQVERKQPINELTALVGLIRRVLGADEKLTPYNKTVDKHFQNWMFKKQAGYG
jgi:type I restriction enzyme R subunit